MNCRFMESSLGRASLQEALLRKDVANHIAGCNECAAYARERSTMERRLGTLRVVEEQPSDELETRLLLNYRAQVSSLVQPPRRSWRWSFAAWAASAAVVLLSIAISFYLYTSKPRDPVVAPTVNTIASTAPAQVPPPEPKTTPKTVQKHARTSAKKVPVEIVDLHGFNPMLYCDQVTCGGPVQIVQVELGGGPGANSQRAELLVGMDGITRAVRMVY